MSYGHRDPRTFIFHELHPYYWHIQSFHFAARQHEPAWPSDKALAGKQKDAGSTPLRLTFVLKYCGLWTLSHDLPLHNEWNIKMTHIAAHLLMRKSCWKTSQRKTAQIICCAAAWVYKMFICMNKGCFVLWHYYQSGLPLWYFLNHPFVIKQLLNCGKPEFVLTYKFWHWLSVFVYSIMYYEVVFMIIWWFTYLSLLTGMHASQFLQYLPGLID